MQYAEGSHKRLPLFFRRTIATFLIVVTLISSISLPKANAVVPILAAPEIALGGFVGVVAVGAIGMELFGYSQQSDDMMAYANAVWVTGNQKMKDAVVSSYNAAVAAGSKTFTISAEVRDWIVDGYTGIFAVSDPKTISSAVAANGEYIGVSRYSDGDIAVTLSAPTGFVYIVGAGYAASVSLNYRSSSATSGFSTLTFGYAGSLPAPTSLSNVSGLRTDIFSDATTNAYYKMRTAAYVPPLSLVPTSTVDGVLAKKNAIRDAFPMALPVPSGQDFIYTPTANPGADVRMRNDGTLADDAGKVYAPNQVTVKSAPVPRVATDAAGVPITDAAGKPVIAVPVGAAGVGTAAVPGTLVNVKTGEAVGTKTGDTTVNPPFDPTVGKINWAPITGLPAMFTTTFPFSLPWDLKRFIDIMTAAPVAPRIEGTYFGNKIVIEMPVFVTTYIPMIRAFFILSFLISLIFTTRKLLGGAQ